LHLPHFRFGTESIANSQNKCTDNKAFLLNLRPVFLLILNFIIFGFFITQIYAEEIQQTDSERSRPNFEYPRCRAFWQALDLIYNRVHLKEGARLLPVVWVKPGRLLSILPQRSVQQELRLYFFIQLMPSR
jgi:hypothetical protein